MAKDSYQVFLDDFNINKKDLYDWGISATVFPDVATVTAAWNDLKKRILCDETVYIRGYGRNARGTQLYKDLYIHLFKNSHIEEDPTNNAIPQRHIQRLTGLQRNSDVYNYQVSHIWGHTKNVFLFEAPWNICYTPKLIDPFTGHEAKGNWPAEYQSLLLKHAYTTYKTFIDDYNQLLISYDVANKINQYLQILQTSSYLTRQQFARFKNDVLSEFAPIQDVPSAVQGTNVAFPASTPASPVGASGSSGTTKGASSRRRYTDDEKYAEAAYYLRKAKKLTEVEEVCLGVNNSGTTAKMHLNQLGIDTSDNSVHKGMLSTIGIDDAIINAADPALKHTLEEIRARGLHLKP